MEFNSGFKGLMTISTKVKLCGRGIKSIWTLVE